MNQLPALHRKEAGQPEGVRQYLSFLLAGTAFAVPMERVAEICPNLKLNVLPHMPKGVEGILDLRGKVIPVINLRIRMGFSPEGQTPENIIILDLPEGQVGVQVDRVSSVLTAPLDEHMPASPLLSGPEGLLVHAFLNREEGIIGLLDLRALDTQGSSHARHSAGDLDMERRLEEGLANLIAMAPPKESITNPVIPSLENAISHTEAEMTRLIELLEGMLAGTDQTFSGITRLKQEARLGRLPNGDHLLADLERSGQETQDHIFEALGTMQFQDIARQKLERVLRHIQGIHGVMGERLREE